VSAPEDLRAAVAAGAFAAVDARRELLQSIVEVARAIFAAKAASVMTHDRATRELVFAAVAGEGAGDLVGRRIPDSTGVAGWVLAAREPIVLEDVASDPRFARDVASSTGFVPSGLMAAPLLHEEGALGVLSVLDRPEQPGFTLSEMELLGLFAHQAALALEMSEGASRARAVLERTAPELEDLAAVAETVGGLEGPARDRALELIGALRALLAQLSLSGG
jgi:GAF domain-containing protein